jgi:hypothetical protein
LHFCVATDNSDVPNSHWDSVCIVISVYFIGTAFCLVKNMGDKLLEETINTKILLNLKKSATDIYKMLQEV